MLILPIRTESETRRTPYVNHVLIAANLFVFLAFYTLADSKQGRAFQEEVLAFHAEDPKLFQYFTYQFLHADPMHLLANMLFLWVFGNSVNGKMGDIAYALFYLAGGVFAAWGHAMITSGPSRLIGASGAIAAVTTAYLVLFPRSRVTVLVWFFVFIQFFEVPAMVLIGLKIIVWDNLVAPALGGQGEVAHSAHLAGYLFGFIGALWMLLVRAVPRDQYDLLALWKRRQRRRELASAFAPITELPPRLPPTSLTDSSTRESPDPADQPGSTESVRSRISEELRKGRRAEAARLYEQLLQVDLRACLSESEQMEIAREYYAGNRFPQAAGAFERFLQHYSRSPEGLNIRLLLGIIYARDLGRSEIADGYLTEVLSALADERRRGQCLEWLRRVRTSLGRPMVES